MIGPAPGGPVADAPGLSRLAVAVEGSLTGRVGAPDRGDRESGQHAADKRQDRRRRGQQRDTDRDHGGDGH